MGDRFSHLLRTKPRLSWMHLGRHPMEWYAGPRSIRSRPFEAARKPWNRRRKPLKNRIG